MLERRYAPLAEESPETEIDAQAPTGLREELLPPEAMNLLAPPERGTQWTAPLISFGTGPAE